MNSQPSAASSDNIAALVAFPQLLFSAMRSMRLYPTSNPQVIRNNQAAYTAFSQLLQQSTGKTVTLSLSDQIILVNGEPLPEKEQNLPQITGLIKFFNRLGVYSLTFTEEFTEQQCVAFITILSELLGQQNLDQPLERILMESTVSTVQVDTKIYVVLHQDEQVVKEDQVGLFNDDAMPVSEEELINYVLTQGKDHANLYGLAPERAESFLERLAEAAKEHNSPEKLYKAVFAFLESLGKDRDSLVHEQQLNTAASTIAGFDPSTLARFFSALPETKISDDILKTTIEKLPPLQLNRLLATLTAHLPSLSTKQEPDKLKVEKNRLLSRVIQLSDATDIKKNIAQNVDTHTLLVTPGTKLENLPENLLKRLQQPEWSASVLAKAIQQSVDPRLSQVQPGVPDTLASMLLSYETLLTKEQQAEVAMQAGTHLAQMDSPSLVRLINHRFKGALGTQLYQEVVEQMPEEQLNQTLEQLHGDQLEKMVTMLCIASQDVPTDKKDAPPALHRLLGSSKGNQVQALLDQNMDARNLLNTLQETPFAEHSSHLLKRLKDPGWSSSVLANAIQQAADPAINGDGRIDQVVCNRLVNYYEQLLDQERQKSVSALAGSKLATMEGMALANLLSHKFRGVFGKKLYQEVLARISDDQLEATVDTLTLRQINRLIAILASETDGGEDQRGHHKETTFLQRLTSTQKSPIIKQVFAQQLDAQLLSSGQTPVEHLPEQVKNRLQQPGWSSPVLVTAANLSVDPGLADTDTIDLKGFNQILTAYEILLNESKQQQVAISAGARIAEDLEEHELGLMLVQRYKGLFGEKLYTEVIKHLSDDKFERLAEQMERFATGQDMLPLQGVDEEVKEAYNNLMRTVREHKLRTVVEIQEKKLSQQEEKKLRHIAWAMEGLLKGNTKTLLSPTFCQALPAEILRFINQKEEGQADALLAQLAVAQQSKEKNLQANSMRTLAITAELLAENGQWSRLSRLLPALEQMLTSPEIDEESSTKTISALSRLAYHHLVKNDYYRAYDTIQIIRGEGSKLPLFAASETVRLHGQKALEQISTEEILNKLLMTFLGSDPDREKAGGILSTLGRISIQYQLQFLMESKSRFERKLLLELIQNAGESSRDLLLKQLEQPNPWYAVRNIIHLLGEIGDPSILLNLQPLLYHRDLRVQKEILTTAGKIGGTDIQGFLVRALISVDDLLKIKVASLMEQFPDEKYVRHLTDLLEGTVPYKGKNEDALQVTICQALAAIGSRKPIASLQRVAQSKGVLGKAPYSERVRAEAAKTVRLLRKPVAPKKSADAKQGSAAVISNNSTHQSPPNDKIDMNELHNKEQAIFTLAKEGKEEEAKKMLFDLVVAMARRGDFENAERLRELFYEIDPMALTEIIRTGEIIEQEKGGAIDEDDLETWSELTDQLTTEEFRAMYHEFRERSYASEETLVHQGAFLDNLFFINQGSVKVSHLMGAKELFITSLSSGKMVGESFFNPSVWTVSLTALTPTRGFELQQSKLVKLEEQFPGLRNKLEAFYKQNSDIPALIRKKGLERRMGPRFKVSRKIQVQPLDKTDNPIGKGFRAELADISKGGLAFLVRITRKENTKLLLGRRMQVILPVRGEGEYLSLKGTSIGIQPHDLLNRDYRVHFWFMEPLTDKAMQGILG
ncbi:MAG: hypothetical protein CSA33_02055 [Desulfobulbus propionicus]|nr:MAG: hypothetical protein CSA33_02055 [Desulfobulbus propionicus]